jgi:hypothetical protein
MLLSSTAVPIRTARPPAPTSSQGMSFLRAVAAVSSGLAVGFCCLTSGAGGGGRCGRYRYHGMFGGGGGRWPAGG